MFQIHSAPRSQAGLSVSLLLHVGVVVLIATGLLVLAPAANATPAIQPHTMLVFLQPYPTPEMLVEPVVVKDKPVHVVVRVKPAAMPAPVLPPVVVPTPAPTPVPVVTPTPPAPGPPAPVGVPLLAATTKPLGIMTTGGFGALAGRASLFDQPVLAAAVIRLPFGSLMGGNGFAAYVVGRTQLFEPEWTPAVILWIPTPGYTEAALALKIQGEVLVEVELVLPNVVRVVRVVNGLGHGLDEAAVDAASQLQFKPATRNDIPVNSRTMIRFKFHEAN